MLRDADQRTVRILDGLLAAWLVLWLVVGGVAGYLVWRVGDVGDTVIESGRGLESAGKAIRSLGDIPIIGEGPAEIGDQVVGAGEDVIAQGEQVKNRVRQTAVLLGSLIVLLPAAPVLGVYLPLRLARTREVAAIRSALAAGDRTVDRHLAERALQSLPYARLRSVSADPWRDVAEGRTRELADLELARLGVRRR